MEAHTQKLALLHCDSSVLRGEIVYEERERFYPPHLLEAWKNRLQERTFQPVEWQYVNGRFVQLYTLGDPDNVADEMRCGGLDIETFSRTFYATLQKPR